MPRIVLNLGPNQTEQDKKNWRLFKRLILIFGSFFIVFGIIFFWLVFTNL